MLEFPTLSFLNIPLYQIKLIKPSFKTYQWLWVQRKEILKVDIIFFIFVVGMKMGAGVEKKKVKCGNKETKLFFFSHVIYF